VTLYAGSRGTAIAAIGAYHLASQRNRKSLLVKTAPSAPNKSQANCGAFDDLVAIMLRMRSICAGREIFPSACGAPGRGAFDGRERVLGAGSYFRPVKCDREPTGAAPHGRGTPNRGGRPVDRFAHGADRGRAECPRLVHIPPDPRRSQQRAEGRS